MGFMKLKREKIPVAVYLRDTEDLDISLDQQRDAARNFVRTTGLENTITFYEDRANAERVEYQNLIKFVMMGVHNLVVCWSADQLDFVFDDLTESTAFMRDLENLDVRFVALKNGFDTQNLIHPFTAILKLVSESKVALKAERMKIGIQAAKQVGKIIGRPPRQFEDILQLRQNRVSIRAIAEQLGISSSTVQAALKRQPKS